MSEGGEGAMGEEERRQLVLIASAIPHWGIKGLTSLGWDIFVAGKYSSTSSHLTATKERSEGGGDAGQG